MSRDGLNTHPLVKRMALDGLGHISLADTNTSHNRSIDDISAIASPDIPMSSNMRTTSIPGYLCDAGSECSQVSSVTSKVSQTVPQPVISCTQPPAGAFASQCMGVHPPPTFVVPYPYTSRPSINSDITHYWLYKLEITEILLINWTHQPIIHFTEFLSSFLPS